MVDTSLLEREAGNSRSVAGVGMLPLEAVADSRLRVVVVWHMAPARSKWPLQGASERQYMTWVIAENSETSRINSSPPTEGHVIDRRKMYENGGVSLQGSVKIVTIGHL